METEQSSHFPVSVVSFSLFVFIVLFFKSQLHVLIWFRVLYKTEILSVSFYFLKQAHLVFNFFVCVN